MGLTHCLILGIIILICKRQISEASETGKSLEEKHYDIDGDKQTVIYGRRIKKLDDSKYKHLEDPTITKELYNKKTDINDYVNNSKINNKKLTRQVENQIETLKDVNIEVPYNINHDDNEEKSGRNTNKDNNIDHLKTDNDSRETSGKSFEVDISKYVSPEFHNRNNVFTLPSSQDYEKYLTSNEHYHSTIGTSINNSTSPTTSAQNLPNLQEDTFEIDSDLTTPKSPSFDEKYKETVESIVQNLNLAASSATPFDRQFLDSKENLNLDELFEDVQNNSTQTTLDYKKFNNILSRSTNEKNAKTGNLIKESGTKVDFNSSYTKTDIIDSESSIESPENDVDYKEGNDYSEEAKGESEKVEILLQKTSPVTTGKSVQTLTKTPAYQNSNHILSNNIETDVSSTKLGASQPATTPVARIINNIVTLEPSSTRKFDTRFTIPPSTSATPLAETTAGQTLPETSKINPATDYELSTEENETGQSSKRSTPIINNSLPDNTISTETRNAVTVEKTTLDDSSKVQMKETTLITKADEYTMTTKDNTTESLSVIKLRTTPIYVTSTEVDASTESIDKLTSTEDTTITYKRMTPLRFTTAEMETATEPARITVEKFKPQETTYDVVKGSTVTNPNPITREETTRESTFKTTAIPTVVITLTEAITTTERTDTSPSATESATRTESVTTNESVTRTESVKSTQSVKTTEEKTTKEDGTTTENTTRTESTTTTSPDTTETKIPITSSIATTQIQETTKNSSTTASVLITETTTPELITLYTTQIGGKSVNSSTVSRPATHHQETTVETSTLASVSITENTTPEATTFYTTHIGGNYVNSSTVSQSVTHHQETTAETSTLASVSFTETTTPEATTFYTTQISGKNFSSVSSSSPHHQQTTKETSTPTPASITETTTPEATTSYTTQIGGKLFNSSTVSLPATAFTLSNWTAVSQFNITPVTFPVILRNVSLFTTEPYKVSVTPDETSTSGTTKSDELSDSSEGNGTIIAIILSSVGCVCLILLAGLLYLMRKRQRRFNYRQRCKPVGLDEYNVDNVSVYNSVRRKGAIRASKRSYGNPAFEDESTVSHPLNLPAILKFANNQEDMHAEFEDIPQITAKTSELPEGCDTKNRYANVIPLPETRVFLNLVEGYPTSDYINANYVTGPKNQRGYYIACQAPMQNTVDDFWRMIWEQQCKVVIMLTHLFENGMEKCFDYLPPSEVLDCHRLFGDFQVTLKKREVKEKYIISNLQLKNMVSNSWREITHFWYLGWPEKGVPEEANSLTAFLIEARSCIKTSTLDQKEATNGSVANGVTGVETHPVVVHCSPGTGRTGTVIACDIAIREFELNRLVDVPKIVYRIRRDRASSVQTKEQYAFIYKVISFYAAKLSGGALDSL